MGTVEFALGRSVVPNEVSSGTGSEVETSRFLVGGIFVVSISARVTVLSCVLLLMALWQRSRLSVVADVALASFTVQ